MFYSHNRVCGLGGNPQRDALLVHLPASSTYQHNVSPVSSSTKAFDVKFADTRPGGARFEGWPSQPVRTRQKPCDAQETVCSGDPAVSCRWAGL
jgi:hypothetical protein